MAINKIEAVLLSIWYAILMVAKRIVTLFTYPIVYPFYDWVYEGVERQNYVRHPKIFANTWKWICWLHYDDDQPKQGPDWYREQSTVFGKYELPLTKWQTFMVAYGWTAIRNPMYNITYCYLGNSSEIVHHEIAYGDYDWDRKLRTSNGDNGIQLAWFLTEKGQSRFIWSLAKQPFGIPLTIFFGWNPNYNGRFTVAFKFK